MAVESHEFEIDKSIIIHLIKSQAGSLSKAILEAVMNSADAGATAIHVDVTKTHMTIRDDGHGLRTRDEILAVFKRFGFDHSQHNRTYGRFGLGRGQLWNWCRTVWHSHNFSLDVDVQERGLQWYLDPDREHTDGLVIEAEFYEPLSAVDTAQLHNELERLVRYAIIPVFLNGKRVGKDPAKSKWDVETEEAYLNVTESSYLAVYNMGVHVTDIYVGQVGIGGTVVTKNGHALTLNIARNDVLRSECSVWKKLNKAFQAMARDRLGAEKTRRITDADRDYLAHQTADPASCENFEKPIFSLSNGKHLTLSQLHNRVTYRREPLTVAETGNRMAEAMLRDRTAVALSQKTLTRFGVATVAELAQTLSKRLAACNSNNLRAYASAFAGGTIAIHEEIEKCPGYKHLQASKIPDAQLSKPQKLFIGACTEMMPTIIGLLHDYDGRIAGPRKVFLGRGDAMAYTDGSSYVAIVDKTAHEAMKHGLSGFLQIAHLIVHEMLHEDDDAGSHAHDLEFMQAFHDITIDHSERLFLAAKQGFKVYARGVERLTQRIAIDDDLLERSTKLVSAA